LHYRQVRPTQFLSSEDSRKLDVNKTLFFLSHHRLPHITPLRFFGNFTAHITVNASTCKLTEQAKNGHHAKLEAKKVVKCLR